MKTILTEKLKVYNKSFRTLEIDPKKIIFEKKIELLCFHCKNYNYKFTCPPKIPKLDYKQIISEYENGLLVYLKMDFNEENYADIRNESTYKLHKALLHLESFLYNNNISTALSFIGGSCKLCKNGCPSDKCNNPYQSRMPMEAVGINVIKTAELVGLKITFPVVDSLYRCGLILW